VADGIDARVDTVQAASSEPLVDRGLTPATLRQLPAPDDPMLASSKIG
jgi:hypothetical protein